MNFWFGTKELSSRFGRKRANRIVYKILLILVLCANEMFLFSTIIVRLYEQLCFECVMKRLPGVALIDSFDLNNASL